MITTRQSDSNPRLGRHSPVITMLQDMRSEGVTEEISKTTKTFPPPPYFREDLSTLTSRAVIHVNICECTIYLIMSKYVSSHTHKLVNSDKKVNYQITLNLQNSLDSKIVIQ